ncbi:MAG: J domain-containing protein [Bacteroidota bacterium]
MKTHYFSNCKTLEEVKKHFKNLAFIHHPDCGGDTARMQEINAEYQSVIKNPFFAFSKQTEEEQHEFIKYPEIISQIIGLNGVTIEIIGNWIWVSGNTYPHREQLKKSGFYFASKKTMWYYRPDDCKSSNTKPKTIEEIRLKYGSDKVANQNNKFELQQ